MKKPSPRALTALIVAGVMLAANIAGFLVIFLSPWNPNTASLWAMMCLATGALVGFIFAVPRLNPETTPSGTYLPNSSIMVISDWLTKILVGVGLVEFHNIGLFLSDTSANLGKALLLKDSLQDENEAAVFALALIVYFFVAGIIQGYLLTRIYIGGKFEELETVGHSPTPPTPGDGVRKS